MWIAREPICQAINPSAVVAYQLFPRRRRPRSFAGFRLGSCRRRRLPSPRIRGGPLCHWLDLPPASVVTEQVQPERLIVACHPGNALSEPWQLAVRDGVLPHNCQTARGMDTFQPAQSVETASPACKPAAARAERKPSTSAAVASINGNLKPPTSRPCNLRPAFTRMQP
jgi:hypothetical protein